ncbi:MAG: CoA protein activase [Bacillota bacterium]|jgi:predicted nucleotide-binding protein (sugar kinase/HSP70/actin superfamily)
MRATFPHMGVAWVGIRYLVEQLGFEAVVPPPVSRRTLELGTKYAPESLCLPFKVNLGNYLEAMEAGVDVVFMVGGIGPCRLGYYAEVQRQIMQDLGIEADLVVLERDNFIFELNRVLNNQGARLPWHRLLSVIRLGLAKIAYLDELETQLLRERYREKRRGSCTRLQEYAIGLVDRADSWAELRRVRREVAGQLAALLGPAEAAPLRVAVVGEIYMLIEPGVNLGIAERLGELGASVERSMYTSTWVREHLLYDPRALRHGRHIARLARPYLPQPVGGHCLETLGFTADYALRGFAGAVQILPLTCMPEIIAETILPTVSSDYRIPVMTITLDEHSGEAGVITRLEAFLDMLRQRRYAAEHSGVLQMI